MTNIKIIKLEQILFYRDLKNFEEKKMFALVLVRHRIEAISNAKINSDTS